MRFSNGSQGHSLAHTLTHSLHSVRQIIYAWIGSKEPLIYLVVSFTEITGEKAFFVGQLRFQKGQKNSQNTGKINSYNTHFTVMAVISEIQQLQWKKLNYIAEGSKKSLINQRWLKMLLNTQGKSATLKYSVIRNRST